MPNLDGVRMDLVELILATDSYQLFAHEQRYNAGKYRVMLSHTAIGQHIAEELQGGDDDWSNYDHAIFDLEWLPFGDGNTLAEAVGIMETKLHAIPTELQDKFYKVYIALMNYMVANKGSVPQFLSQRNGSMPFRKLATMDVDQFTTLLKG